MLKNETTKTKRDYELNKTHYCTKKISFIIPTFNAEKYFERCLNSINMQDYPEEHVEIIIADGGSTDGTLRVAKKHGCKIIIDPTINLPEPRIIRAAQEEQGDIIFILSADNELTSNDWITNMIKPFENPNVYGVFTSNVSSLDDKGFNKYFNLLQNDPFSWYLWEKENPKDREKRFPILEKKDNYIIFDFNLENYLLIAFAQGFGIRKEFKDNKKFKELEYDDILPVIEMIKNYRIAYVPDVGIYHHSLDSFWHFIFKFNYRIKERFENPKYGVKTREKYYSEKRKVRKYAWFIYSFTLIGPIIDMIKGFWRDRSIYWIYHPFACFALSCLITTNFIKFNFGRIKGKIKYHGEL